MGFPCLVLLSKSYEEQYQEVAAAYIFGILLLLVMQFYAFGWCRHILFNVDIDLQDLKSNMSFIILCQM